MSDMIERSRRHVLEGTHWMLDESTFSVLNEEYAIWIARVTTTHLTARGEAEHSFYVLASRMAQYVMLDDKELAALGTYIQERI